MRSMTCVKRDILMLLYSPCERIMGFWQWVILLVPLLFSLFPYISDSGAWHQNHAPIRNIVTYRAMVSPNALVTPQPLKWIYAFLRMYSSNQEGGPFWSNRQLKTARIIQSSLLIFLLTFLNINNHNKSYSSFVIEYLSSHLNNHLTEWLSSPSVFILILWYTAELSFWRIFHLLLKRLKTF